MGHHSGATSAVTKIGPLPRSRLPASILISPWRNSPAMPATGLAPSLSTHGSPGMPPPAQPTPTNGSRIARAPAGGECPDRPPQPPGPAPEVGVGPVLVPHRRCRRGDRRTPLRPGPDRHAPSLPEPLPEPKPDLLGQEIVAEVLSGFLREQRVDQAAHHGLVREIADSPAGIERPFARPAHH